jgi:hypothetical protein
MSALFRRPDTSGAERQLEEQRKENARMRAEAEAERIDIAEQASARRRARQRGGSRMLLSEARVAPEMGIQTFGVMGTERTES